MISEVSKTTEIIRKYGISADKKYGQNFLVDTDVVNKVGSLINNDDIVIEVGPGLGSLTEILCQKAKKVIAYEIDARMVEVLKETVQYDNLELINCDFLSVDLESVIYQEGSYVFVSNLPYYITAQILEKVFYHIGNIRKVIVMMQKEVGLKYTNPDVKEYGPLNVLMNYRSKVNVLTKVGKHSFIPAPNVDSVILDFDINNQIDNNAFFDFIYQSFEQRRKVLTSNLKEYGITTQTLKEIGLSETSRAEELKLNDFLKLFEYRKVIEKSYAKINVSLNVTGKREDGYHLLDMIMVPIDLYDDVEISLNDRDEFICNIDLKYDEHNTVYKAVELMREKYHFNEHFKINIFKRIPTQAGLAGGSGNAAAVLRGINKLLGLQLSLEELTFIGVKIGADVPYCIYNKCARVSGIGEKLSFFELKKTYSCLIIKPNSGISTKEAYKILDIDKCEHPNIDECLNNFKKHLPMKLGNSLEYSAFILSKEIKEIKDECLRYGFDNVLMSGSGSTVFVLYENKDINNLKEYMQKQGFYVVETTIILN